jgi:hypothetical protein
MSKQDLQDMFGLPEETDISAETPGFLSYEEITES